MSLQQLKFNFIKNQKKAKKAALLAAKERAEKQEAFRKEIEKMQEAVLQVHLRYSFLFNKIQKESN